MIFTIKRMLAAIFCAIIGSAWAAGLSPSVAQALTVYLAPAAKGGSNSHTGLSRSSPLLTLARVQQVLERRKPTDNVYVRIDQGTYVAGQVNWSFYVPGHTISFIPINYIFGRGRPAGGDPVFIDSTSASGHTAGWWFHARLPGASTHPLHNGGKTGLGFHYLRVEDYTNGLSLDGQTGHVWRDSETPQMYIRPSSGLNGNTVSGMTFSNIGNQFAPGQTGYGAILLTDSSGNVITNNTFDNIENVASQAEQIHGIYVTHFSSVNAITANQFTAITGEAVKVRDRSDFNMVARNRFDATGGVSAYLDEFCDLSCAKASPGNTRQCASYGNRFVNNTIGTVFGTDAPQRNWSLNPFGSTYAGGAGCSIPKGEIRVFAGGNT